MIDDVLSMSTHYKPAWSFANAAVRWAASCTKAQAEPEAESAHLALLYSALSLEALIAETLDAASTRVNVDALFGRRVSVAQRWRDGSSLLSTGSAASVRAVTAIAQECQDRGNLGLLLRARNKLVHARASTEVFDVNGHAIQDGPIATLVRDLRDPPANLPVTRPAFPVIIQCRASAEWSTMVLSRMTRLLFDVLEVDLNQAWQNTLATA